MSRRAGQTASVVAIFGISVAGYVALAITGQATVEYVALVGPILGAAFLVPRLGQQDQVLGKIEHNTNGALSQRIKDAVQAALEERDAATPSDPRQ